MTLNAELATEIQKLAPSAMIELFELDATSVGGSVIRFHAGTNQLRQDIVWQGDTYNRFPIEATGFEFNGQGQFPRPKIRVSNILSAITTVLLATDDLIGAKLTRKRTLAKFLDAVNFTGGVNPTADDTAEFDNDIYYVDRKASEDKDVVEFDLSSALEQQGINLPRRQIIQNVCVWKYRGAECGYTGPPLYDVNDEQIAQNSGTSSHGASLIQKEHDRKHAKEDLDDAQLALSRAARDRDAACAIVLLSTHYHAPPLFAPPIAGDYFVSERTDTGALKAYWNGASVALGTTYRRGARKAGPAVATGVEPVNVNLYEIQQWGNNAGACSTATTAYTSALAARNTAQTNLTTAETDLETAHTVLPVDDNLYLRERCGKRLESCKLRFGEHNPLPFGSFPAAGLFK